jgi:enolase
MIIKKVKAKKIKNSRGEETIKVKVKSDSGKGEASAPSGASKGKHEAKDFIGPVDNSIKFLNDCKELIGLEINNFEDLKKVEKIVDKEKYGGNTVIALEYAILNSMGAIWKRFNEKTRKIPRPLGNVIGGGMHCKNSGSDFQEFLVYPIGSKNLEQDIGANNKVHELAKKKLNEVDKNFKNEITDEGAWVSGLSNTEILDLLSEVVKEVSKEFNFQIRLGLDIAASSFWDGEHYNYNNFSKEEKNKKLTKKEQIEFISEIIDKYNLLYIEDALHEEDFSGFAELTKKFKDKCMITGDDLTVTNMSRLKKAIKQKSINAAIVKPNQIGSLIEMKKFVDELNKNKFYSIISHRSGETLDASISHLAVGLEIPIIKCGIYGKERVSKLNELRKIEAQIKLKV